VDDIPDQSFSFELIPFLVSIAIEVASPVLSKFVKFSLQRSIHKELEEGHEVINQFVEFGSDAMMGFSSLLLTMSAAVAIPFLRARGDLGGPMLIALAFFLALFLMYFVVADPIRHASRRLAGYSLISLGTILLNLILIYFLAVQWGLISLPFWAVREPTT